MYLKLPYIIRYYRRVKRQWTLGMSKIFSAYSSTLGDTFVKIIIYLQIGTYFK